jgi:hypothetical protein
MIEVTEDGAVFEHECSWCGLTEPLTEGEVKGTNEAQFHVIAFPGTDDKVEYFHAPCQALMVAYQMLAAALEATGWNRTTFEMNVDLLASGMEDQT